MKTLFFSFWLVLGCGSFLRAQDSPPPAREVESAAPLRSPEELDQLLGPIALYPDALIALILPATTVPADIVLAVRYLQDSSYLSQVENRAWDDSVKSLTRYPEVLTWLDRNLTWTKQVGEAFVAQPAEVMNTVQRLRAKARAAGTLVDTPQQQVVVQPDAISIVPAQSDVIYVPYYDPLAAFGSRPYYPNSFFSFSPAYATGLWLSYSVDWNRRRVNFVNRSDREHHWRDCREYWRRAEPANRVIFRPNQNYFRPWIPPAHYSYSSRPGPNPPPRLRAPAVPRTVTYANSTESQYNGTRYNPTTSKNLPTPTRPNPPGQRPASAEVALAMPRHRTLGPSAPVYVQTPASPAVPVPTLALANPLPQPLPSPLPAKETAPASAPRYRRNVEQRSDSGDRGNRGGSNGLPGSLAFAGPGRSPQTVTAPRLNWTPPPPSSRATTVAPAPQNDAPTSSPKSEANIPNARGWNRDRTGR